MYLISLASCYTNYTSEDIFTRLIWLTLFTTCYITYTCHGFPYEVSSLEAKKCFWERQTQWRSKYMLTLESWRFPVLGEVSFCTRTLPNLLIQVGSDSLLLCSVIYKFVITSTFNCHGTKACLNFLSLVFRRH